MKDKSKEEEKEKEKEHKKEVEKKETWWSKVPPIWKIGSAAVIFIKYLELQQKVTLNSTIYQTLTNIYEQSRLELAQEKIYFQVIDSAITPLMKAKPHRTRMIFMAFISSSMLAIFLVLFLEWLKGVRKIYKNKTAKEEYTE